MESARIQRRRRLSNAAFVVSFVLLGLLAAWWTILISRTVNENYALKVEQHGETETLLEDHARKRFMLLGEASLASLLALALVGLAWRAAQVERRQVRQLEGLLTASTHELKTPVAGVRALLESLQSGVLPPARMGPHLEQGLRSLGRLELLIESVLARQAAVANAGRPLRPTRLRALCEELVDARGLESPGQALHVEGPEAVVEADADALRVVLENLLDNARKYGRGEPVRVCIEPRGVAVRDAGEGFGPEEAEALFQPYARGAGAGPRRGTGLGLYIARDLARSMGAELHAESAGPGKGATFRLTFP